MSLLLTGSREHALLAMIIQEAADFAQQSGSYLGRTAVRMIAYFVQILGVPMRYRFDIHHYGPYCESVSRHIDWLIADGVVTDHSSTPERYSNYRPGPGINDLLARHEKDLEPHRQTVRNVIRALLPLQPENLELIATLHYLYREQKASRPNGPWKQAVLARFFEVKKDKFAREVVEKDYDQLVSAGLVEP